MRGQVFSPRPLALCLALTACGTSEDDTFFMTDAELDATDTTDAELHPFADGGLQSASTLIDRVSDQRSANARPLA